MNILKHIAFLTVIGGLTTLPVIAQVQPIDYVEKQQAEANAAAKGGPAAEKVLRLDAAAEPVPALHIRFWPNRFEMVNGNTFVPFQRAMIMVLERHSPQPDQDPFVQNYELWMQGPLEDLPKQEVAKYLDQYQVVIKELHRAMRMRDSHYELGIDDLRGLETVQLLLPEFQNMRQLARLLVLETRLAIAEGRTDDAIHSIRVGFRMGEATGNAADLLISRLVGVAISSMMLEQVEQLLQQENSPNMYWALASLPDSIWSMDEAIQFEASIAARVFPALSNLPDDDVEPAVWRSRLTQAISDMQSLNDLGIGTSNAEARMLAGAMVVALTEPSRAHLIAAGMDAERVQAMSPSEAVLRATAEEIQRIQDNFSKWMLLPDAMRMQYAERSDATLQQIGGRGSGISSLAGMATNLLMPAITAANRAGIRTRQTIARLATIEALRDHLAREGELPESLDQLTNLPAWPDPFTQQPFGYQRVSATRAKLISVPAYPTDPNATIMLEVASP